MSKLLVCLSNICVKNVHRCDSVLFLDLKMGVCFTLVCVCVGHRLDYKLFGFI